MWVGIMRDVLWNKGENFFLRRIVQRKVIEIKGKLELLVYCG